VMSGVGWRCFSNTQRHRSVPYRVSAHVQGQPMRSDSFSPSHRLSNLLRELRSRMRAADAYRSCSLIALRWHHQAGSSQHRSL